MWLYSVAWCTRLMSIMYRMGSVWNAREFIIMSFVQQIRAHKSPNLEDKNVFARGVHWNKNHPKPTHLSTQLNSTEWNLPAQNYTKQENERIYTTDWIELNWTEANARVDKKKSRLNLLKCKSWYAVSSNFLGENPFFSSSRARCVLCHARLALVCSFHRVVYSICFAINSVMKVRWKRDTIEISAIWPRVFCCCFCVTRSVGRC